MPTEYISDDELSLSNEKGQIDWKKLDSLTDEDIERFAQEDGFTLDENTPGKIHYHALYVRNIRKRLKLTQEEFARHFGIRLRTLQEWEQGRAEPEGPAQVLLRIIDREPEAVERALKAS